MVQSELFKNSNNILQYDAMLALKKEKRVGWKFGRYGRDFHTATKNLESRV